MVGDAGPSPTYQTLDDYLHVAPQEFAQAIKPTGYYKEKAKWLRCLERRVFHPILQASPEGYAASDQKTLAWVKHKTEQEQERYHRYHSAGHVRQAFEDDLHAAAAQRVNAGLHRLHLPTLATVQEAFCELAERLGITRGERKRVPHPAHPPHPWHKKTPAACEQAWEELRQQAHRGDKRAQDILRTAEEEDVRAAAAKESMRSKAARKAAE
jgi:hypothetical protein